VLDVVIEDDGQAAELHRLWAHTEHLPTAQGRVGDPQPPCSGEPAEAFPCAPRQESPAEATPVVG
jgi:hypothetical protein